MSEHFHTASTYEIDTSNVPAIERPALKDAIQQFTDAIPTDSLTTTEQITDLGTNMLTKGTELAYEYGLTDADVHDLMNAIESKVATKINESIVQQVDKQAANPNASIITPQYIEAIRNVPLSFNTVTVQHDVMFDAALAAYKKAEQDGDKQAESRAVGFTIVAAHWGSEIPGVQQHKEDHCRTNRKSAKTDADRHALNQYTSNGFGVGLDDFAGPVSRAVQSVRNIGTKRVVATGAGMATIGVPFAATTAHAAPDMPPETTITQEYVNEMPTIVPDEATPTTKPEAKSPSTESTPTMPDVSESPAAEPTTEPEPSTDVEQTVPAPTETPKTTPATPTIPPRPDRAPTITNKPVPSEVADKSQKPSTTKPSPAQPAKQEVIRPDRSADTPADTNVQQENDAPVADTSENTNNSTKSSTENTPEIKEPSPENDTEKSTQDLPAIIAPPVTPETNDTYSNTDKNDGAVSADEPTTTETTAPSPEPEADTAAPDAPSSDTAESTPENTPDISDDENTETTTDTESEVSNSDNTKSADAETEIMPDLIVDDVSSVVNDTFKEVVDEEEEEQQPETLPEIIVDEVSEEDGSDSTVGEAVINLPPSGPDDEEIKAAKENVADQKTDVKAAKSKLDKAKKQLRSLKTTKLEQAEDNQGIDVVAAKHLAKQKGQTPKGTSWKNTGLVIEYLVKEGLTVNQAIGICANMMHESNGVNPKQHQIGGPAFGLVQWEGPRRAELESYAAARGKNVGNLYVQLDFMMLELERDAWNGYAELKQANNYKEAAIIFEDKFERAGVVNMDTRLDMADKIARQYNKHWKNVKENRGNHKKSSGNISKAKKQVKNAAQNVKKQKSDVDRATKRARKLENKAEDAEQAAKEFWQDDSEVVANSSDKTSNNGMPSLVVESVVASHNNTYVAPDVEELDEGSVEKSEPNVFAAVDMQQKDEEYSAGAAYVELPKSLQQKAEKKKAQAKKEQSEAEKLREMGEKTVEKAKQFENYSYLWGGGYADVPAEGFMDAFNSGGFQKGEQILDCGGLVRMAIYDAHGVDIGPLQFNDGKDVVVGSGHFVEVPLDEAKAGDVFWTEGHVGLIKGWDNEGKPYTYDTFEATGGNLIGDQERNYKNPTHITKIYRFTG